LDFLAANETPPNHNNRSRASGGVCEHITALDFSIGHQKPLNKLPKLQNQKRPPRKS
jgi:hypothetical protein